MSSPVTVFFDIFDSGLPLVFIIGDHILRVLVTPKKGARIAINLCKLFSILIMVGYLCYLYLYMGEAKRESDNRLELIIYIIVTFFMVYSIVFNIRQDVELENKVKQLEEQLDGKTNEEQAEEIK